jgi:isoquinoline 1-oxidoreductase
MNPTDLPAPPWEPERYELYEEPRYRFEPDRRAFLGAAGGIVVLLTAAEADAQQPGRGRGRGFGRSGPQELSARLHIGEDGTVTVYTSKVEVGQNSRTSLSQAVAEELRVPVAAVRLVMGDTALTPNDGGTSGSQTTPSTFPQVRRAAAAARELLIDLAAKQANVERGSFLVAGGKVSHPPTGQSFAFGELTRGQKLTKTVPADVRLTPAAEWKVIGTSVPKVEGRAIVTGKHRYASDVTRPGLLHGKVLRPTAFNATLVSVDLAGARALPGVVAVHDGEFIGVAAPSAALAEQARNAIRAEWKSPPQLADKELFESLKKEGGEGGFGGRFGGRGNQNRGSVAQGLTEADHTLQATYTVAYIAHAPLEPRAAVAEWHEGKLTVWTGTQQPGRVRGELAQTFRLAEERVRVLVPDTGSGYGGKHTGEAAVEAARLAKAAGRPVKLVWTREEEFTWAYFRPAGVIEVNAGVKKDGMLTAWEAHNYNAGPSGLQSPYEVAHRQTAFHRSQAPLRQGSYRALAATANHFARESHMDDLAHAAGQDPLAFRLKNLKDARLRAVLEAAARQFGWGGARPARGHGVGLAVGTEKGSYVATCAEVAVNRSSGRVQVVRMVTAFECGAIVNPEHLKNQVEGAAVMGLGGALWEAIRFEGGKVFNARFADYRVPRFADVPVLETVLVDRRDLPSAGAGETPIVAVAPAIGNAIFQVTGLRLRSLPMVPDGLKG